MTWKAFFISSLGKKLVMALTGISLILFLIVHAGANSCIFLNDGGATFNSVAHFLSHNIIVRVLELGLFTGIILHIVQGLMLWGENSAKRPVKYAVSAGNATSKWYSRSMGLLGSLILIFLVIHLSHFWLGTKDAMYVHLNPDHNLYEEMKMAFQKEWVVIVYVLGVISLGWHLIHGFSSAFQTLGVNSPKYNGMIKNIGFGYTILVCLAFIAMPIAFYLKLIQ
jgi:succinate dehydrogenase / fumarate reductase, cytochrome b subunit